jgi:hypothetical protein
MIGLQSLPQVDTALGGLGKAAFGVVDTTKVFWGGVNHIRFKGIETAVLFVTLSGQPARPANGLPPADILVTLQANWYNGTGLDSQKSIAKSLIELYLNQDNSPAMGTSFLCIPKKLKWGRS